MQLEEGETPPSVPREGQRDPFVLGEGQSHRGHPPEMQELRPPEPEADQGNRIPAVPLAGWQDAAPW